MSVAFSIGKGRRNSLKTSPNAKYVPGPGTHNPKESIVVGAAPKWAFGSGKRSVMHL